MPSAPSTSARGLRRGLASSGCGPSEIEADDQEIARRQLLERAGEIDDGDDGHMLERARGRFGEDAGELRTVALGHDQRVDAEGGRRAQYGADIMRVGHLIEDQNEAAFRLYVGDIRLGQGARLQHQALMHALLAEPLRQRSRLDDLRREAGGGGERRDALGGAFRRIERQQFAPSGDERLAHRMGAIEHDDIAGGPAEGRLLARILPRRRAAAAVPAVAARAVAVLAGGRARHRSTAVFTHQPLCWRRMTAAARAAAWRVENNAKQVAPEPDIRASRHPLAADNTASASTMTGASTQAASSISLRPLRSAAAIPSAPSAAEISGCGAAPVVSPGRQAEAGEDAARLHRRAGIDQHGGERRQAERRADRLAPAEHVARARGEADGHVGAGGAGGLQQARIVGGKAIGAGQQAQRRGGVRGAAAYAGGDRQIFGELERPEAQAGDALGEAMGGAQHQILGHCAGGGGGRAIDGERERLARREAQRIASAGEGDEALELVIAVGAAAENMKGQIDLGGGARREHEFPCLGWNGPGAPEAGDRCAGRAGPVKDGAPFLAARGADGLVVLRVARSFDLE